MKTSYTFSSDYASPIDKLVRFIRHSLLSYVRTNGGVRLLDLAPNDLELIRAKVQELGYIHERVDTIDVADKDNQVSIAIPVAKNGTATFEQVLNSAIFEVFKSLESITYMKVVDGTDYAGVKNADTFVLVVRGIQRNAN